MKNELARQQEVAREAIEDVFIENQHQTFEENIETLFSLDSPKREKLKAGLDVLHKIFPEPFKKYVEDRFAYRFELLPLSDELERPGKKFGKGGANIVFLLEAQNSTQDSIMLKIPYRGTLAPEEYAKKDRQEYLEIEEAFGDLEDFVVSEQHLVMHSPRGGKPTAAVVQKFQGTNVRDIFTEIGEGELREMLLQEENIRTTLTGFLDILRERPELIEKEIDILGKKNLSIVETEDGPKLRFLDPHYRANTGEETDSVEQITDAGEEPDSVQRITERCSYLQGVLDSLEGVE